MMKLSKRTKRICTAAAVAAILGVSGAALTPGAGTASVVNTDGTTWTDWSL
jgi:hypothetical protein